MSRRRVTSFDVAREAGVSRTTVSFVLNDAPNQTIPDKTRDAVLGAARRLGYTPSAAARALRVGTSRLVLVLGPTSQPSELIDEGLSALTHRLRDVGYATVVAPSASEDDTLDVLWASVSPAIVVSMYDMPEKVRATLGAMNIPIVDAPFHTSPAKPGSYELQVDVGAQQAEHVILRGADDVVFAHPPREGPDVPILDDRLRGARETAEQRGAAFDTLEVDDSDALLTDLATVFASAGSRRVAFCAYNDRTALQIVRAARSLDLVAPDDFMIIGVDDNAVAEFCDPPLSSVRFEVAHHIEALANEVIHALHHDPMPADASSGPYSRVVVRQST